MIPAATEYFQSVLTVRRLNVPVTVARYVYGVSPFNLLSNEFQLAYGLCAVVTPPINLSFSFISRISRYDFIAANQWRIQGGFLVARKPPPSHDFLLIRGVTPLLAPTFTSHLHVRRSETPLQTNSGYATANSQYSCFSYNHFQTG